VRNAVNYSIWCAKSEYYRHKLNENATWKVLNDLMGKNQLLLKLMKFLRLLDTTLKNAGHIANHFNVHFTEIGPRLASNIPA